MKSKFVIVEWPEIQSYIDKEGFDNNCCLINDDTWLDQYGALSYFVNEEWKHKVDEKYILKVIINYRNHVYALYTYN